MFKTWIVNRESGIAPIDNSHPYLVLAYYHLASIESPEEKVREHQAFFASLDVKGRIYLAKQGINGTISAPKEDAFAYIEWLWSMPEFQTAEFKIQEYHD